MDFSGETQPKNVHFLAASMAFVLVWLLPAQPQAWLQEFLVR